MVNNNTNTNIESELYNIHTFALDTKNRELYLHSSLDNEDESGVDYKTAVTFEKNIRYLNLISNEPILVHMHLPGGIWEDGLGIYDTIVSSKAKIIILAYAKVESASSIIFQAAAKRILMPNTHVLIHYGSLSIDNEHKAAMSSFQWSEKESNKMIDIFTARCLDSPMALEKNWKKMIIKKHIMSQLANKSDWILQAEEAVHYGFADGVLGDRKYPNIDYLKNKIK
jgi:ATP-dependent protease ClpP protease subunit